MNNIIEFVIMLTLAFIYFKWILPNYLDNIKCDLSNKSNNFQNDSRIIKKYSYTAGAGWTYSQAIAE